MNLPELPAELDRWGYGCGVEGLRSLVRSYGEECTRMERERIAGMRSQFIKLAEAVEAAGYRRGLQGKPPSDYEPEICRLINAFDVAIRAETVSDGIQRKV